MKGQTLRSRFLETCARCSRLLMLLVLAGCTTPVTITSQLASVATSTSRPDASAVALDSATATSAPQPTPADTTGSTPRPVPAVTPSPPPAPIAGTLVLYTTTVTDTSGQAYWAFRTFPPLPRLDATAFDTLYGLNNGSNDFSLFFADFRPQPSPDGQTLLVPGLRGHPNMASRLRAHGSLIWRRARHGNYSPTALLPPGTCPATPSPMWTATRSSPSMSLREPRRSRSFSTPTCGAFMPSGRPTASGSRPSPERNTSRWERPRPT